MLVMEVLMPARREGAELRWSNREPETGWCKILLYGPLCSRKSFSFLPFSFPSLPLDGLIPEIKDN